MKIVHIIDYFQPQLGYQESYLSRYQIASGHEVHVITSERYAPILYPAAEHILGKRKKSPGISVEEGIHVVRLPIYTEIFGRVWLKGIGEILASISPDLIIVHGFASIAVLQVLLMKKKLLQTKIIIDDHMVSSAVRSVFKLAYILIRLLISPYVLKQADAIVATHEESIEFMMRQYGLSSSMIHYIPLGCDTSLFKYNENTRQQLREELGYKSDDVVFIYAGKVIPDKGPHLLVQAACSLIDDFPNVKVLIVGNGSSIYMNKIRRYIANRKLSHHFKFVDLVPNSELTQYYSTADVGVWPLQCSLTMIEAMACSKPIIISNNSGTPDRVKDGSGFLYDEYSVDDLENKMKLLMNSSLRQQMGFSARKFAESHDWSMISQRFLNLVGM